MTRGYASQCAVKISYTTEEEAQKAIRSGAKLYPYRCLNCSYFHLSHKRMVRGKRR
jgi:hypothetical protein